MRDKLIRILQAVVLLAVVSSFAHAGAGDLLYIKKKATSAATSWSKVGETTAVIDNATNGTQNITLPGTVLTGDLVLVALAADGAIQNEITTAGYTSPENGSSGNPGAHFGYKVMGASPDSVVTVITHTAYKKACVVQVWRGADTATPLDNTYATITDSSGTSANPDPPATVTLSNNALVVAIAYLDDDDSTVSSYPTGYTNGISANTGQASGSVGATIAISSKVVATAGAEDPAAYTMSSADVWAAGTISFRKAP